MSAVEKREIARIPEIPWLVACQKASVPIPLAAITPSPVMTARLGLAVSTIGMFILCKWGQKLLLFPIGASEDKGTIHTAEAAGMGKCDVDGRWTRYVGYIIQ